MAEPIALRTVLPADLGPGASEVVPLHVVPPAEPGRYELRLELVHEGVGVFAQTAPLELEVEPRERIALVGEPAEVMRLLAQLSAPPYVEPVIVLGNDSDRLAYGDYACVSGLREPLLAGLEASGRLSRALRLPWRSWSLTRAAHRFRRRGSSGVVGLDTLCELLQDARGLFVAGTDWPPDAAPGREWWRLVTTTAVARAVGCPVYVADGAVPSGSRARDIVLRRDPAPNQRADREHDTGAPREPAGGVRGRARCRVAHRGLSSRGLIRDRAARPAAGRVATSSAP